VVTAKDWGLKPSEFWASSESDKAYMIATTRTQGKMATWERMQSKPRD